MFLHTTAKFGFFQNQNLSEFMADTTGRPKSNIERAVISVAFMKLATPDLLSKIETYIQILEKEIGNIVDLPDGRSTTKTRKKELVGIGEHLIIDDQGLSIEIAYKK